MSTKTTFLLPDFDKNIPNKVHEKVEVKSQHVLSIKEAPEYHSAIATCGFSSKTDGVYVFATKIGNIGLGALYVGFTDVKSYDSKRRGFLGRQLTGTSLDCYFGKRWPGEVPYLPSNITQKAKEIISILTISNNGGKIEIQWIGDGNEGPVHDCTDDFGNGDEIFPCISFGFDGQQVELIPFDQVKSRSPLIEKFLKEYSSSTNQSKGAVANNNNNINNNMPSPAPAQLQQELEKEKKRADLAEAELKQERQNSATKDQQLQQKDQLSQQQSSEIAQLKQQLLTLQSQLNNNNNSLVLASPFVKDKLYQIDFAANGLSLPTDRSTFGSLLSVAPTSPIFLEAKKLMRKLGTFYPSQKPVAGFTLEGVDVIAQSASGFDDILFRLQQFRTHGGGIFNPSTTKYSAEQLQVLIYLNKLFLDRPSDAHDKAPDLINVFHGTKRGVLQSAVNGLVAVRSTDAGFFGLGAYTTPNIEYAARYAMGEFNPTSTDFTPRADGSFPVIWCVAAVGVCYPLTREKDYGQNKQWNGMGVSDFFGSPLKSDANGKFDCHCVLVNESANYQAVPRHEMQYMEIVFDQTSQILPIAVLWMKPV